MPTDALTPELLQKIDAFWRTTNYLSVIIACVVREGETETGPLGTAWHSYQMFNPATDGAVLPILLLNGYKVSNPTLLARIDQEELEHLFLNCGWTPTFVEGDKSMKMHQAMAAATDCAVELIQRIQPDARQGRPTVHPSRRMIVLHSPKGWTGPKEVDAVAIEDRLRAHQIPLLLSPAVPEHLHLVEA